MFDWKNWIPPGPVAFAFILSIAAVAGDIFSKEAKNPIVFVFYSFLPAIFWMLMIEQKRNAKAIQELRTRIDRLENSK